jgi:ABC exporter DevB family membrane fusion protein
MKTHDTLHTHGLTSSVLFGFSGLVAGTLATYTLLRPQTVPTQTPLVAQAQEPVNTEVAALGYLEPQGEVIKLSAPVAIQDAIIERLLVNPGDTVKKGQIVALLDSYERLKASLEEAQARVKVAQAKLLQIQAGAKTGEIQAQQAKFHRTKAELEGQKQSQQATIANLEAQKRGEMMAQSATIKRIQAELLNAQNECDRYQRLFEDGAVSAQEKEKACLQRDVNQERLDEARATLNRIENTLQSQINQAEANLTRTINTLERQILEDQAVLDSVSEIRPVDIQLAQAELEAAQAQVRKAKTELNLGLVYAPQDGQVLKIHAHPGEKVKEQGILDLGKTQEMYVQAEIYETDIRQIEKGQKATIKSDGVIEELQGTVEQIGLQIEKQQILSSDPSADVDGRVIEVKIRLNPEDSKKVAGFTNLQVNVIIDTSRS